MPLLIATSDGFHHFWNEFCFEIFKKWKNIRPIRLFCIGPFAHLGWPLRLLCPFVVRFISFLFCLSYLLLFCQIKSTMASHSASSATQKYEFPRCAELRQSSGLKPLKAYFIFWFKDQLDFWKPSPDLPCHAFQLEKTKPNRQGGTIYTSKNYHFLLATICHIFSFSISYSINCSMLFSPDIVRPPTNPNICSNKMRE